MSSQEDDGGEDDDNDDGDGASDLSLGAETWDRPCSGTSKHHRRILAFCRVVPHGPLAHTQRCRPSCPDSSLRRDLRAFRLRSCSRIRLRASGAAERRDSTPRRRAQGVQPALSSPTMPLLVLRHSSTVGIVNCTYPLLTPAQHIAVLTALVHFGRRGGEGGENYLQRSIHPGMVGGYVPFTVSATRKSHWD